MRAQLELRRWVLAAACLLGCTAAAAAGTFSTIYNFDDPTKTGNMLVAPQIVEGRDGSLYGVEIINYSDDKSGINVSSQLFRLSPPQRGQTQWQYSVLYAFDPSVDFPTDLLIDASGSLYDLENASYGNQYVEKFSPPKSGAGPWTRTLVYQSSLSDPTTDRIEFIRLSHTGAILGNGDKVVFRLTPPALGQGVWNLSVLYKQPAGASPLLLEGFVEAADGSLFGRAKTTGTPIVSDVLWKLTPPGASHPTWAFATIDSMNFKSASGFSPGIASVDRSDHLYDFNESSSQGYDIGTVFRLSPPGAGQTAWRQDVLYAFQGTSDSGSPTALVEGPDGKLYGVNQCLWDPQITSACPGVISKITGEPTTVDTLFKLTPRDYGGRMLPWNHQVLRTFSGATSSAGGTDPKVLISGSLQDGTFALFGVTTAGGTGYLGTIFQYVP